MTKLSILKSDRDTDKEGKINLAASASNTGLCGLLTDRVNPCSVQRVLLFLRSGTSCYSIVSGLLFALPWSLPL